MTTVSSKYGWRILQFARSEKDIRRNWLFCSLNCLTLYSMKVIESNKDEDKDAIRGLRALFGRKSFTRRAMP